MTPLMAALIPHSWDQPHINLAELEYSRHPIEMLQYISVNLLLRHGFLGLLKERD
jgi:hypothetical protein